MKIRFVGLLTEEQVTKGLAGYKKIKPADGIFIRGGLSYTFTFKNGVASAVTIRRAPVITILDEPEVEATKPEVEATKPTEPIEQTEPIETSEGFAIGDKVAVTGVPFIISFLKNIHNGTRGTIESLGVNEISGKPNALVVWDKDQGEDILPKDNVYGFVKAVIPLEDLEKIA